MSVPHRKAHVNLLRLFNKVENIDINSKIRLTESIALGGIEVYNFEA